MSQHEETNNALRDLLEATNAAGFFQLLGMRIEATDIGKGKVSIRVDERLMHPLMIVHGGVTFTLADTAMSMAILSVYPAGTRVSTIEAKINYLLPVRAGELIAEANIVQQGRQVAVTEATVFNINEGTSQAIARILGTFSIRQPNVK
jgi:acyl-CoA thioesterase